MSKLLQAGLRQQAVFIPAATMSPSPQHLTPTTGMLVARLAKSGYGVSEELLSALNRTLPAYHSMLIQTMEENLGLHKNWTPLVKGWDTPTGESVIDHLITLFVNLVQGKGTALPCGHTIPPGTFPLERYNGCPFCGTPFQFGELENFKQGSHIKILELWSIRDAENFLQNLLLSKTALDATQMDSLKILLSELPLPAVEIGMKETLMAVIDLFVEQGKQDQAQALFSSPADILRYLWYKHTGLYQVAAPKTLVSRNARNHSHRMTTLNRATAARETAGLKIKLKYTRKECLVVASWLNNLPMRAGKICEMMHARREMWVRFIRALRLPEYSKRAGFEKLKEILDHFYNEVYEVWQGRVDQSRIRYDVKRSMQLLQQRPGLFARSLFSNMLWFGPGFALPAFEEVIDKVPARLVFTLDMYADNYFDKEQNRVVKTLGGVSKKIAPNQLLSLYTDAQLKEMRTAVSGLCLTAMKKRFAAQPTSSRTVYIDPQLYKIPVSIGDRSDTVQDVSAALMGARFAVEGETVRLFMQWGHGLPAQHLDMDLSCRIVYLSRTETCSYSNLAPTGCKHSGDIRSIPEKTGTAEYIEVDLSALHKAGARFVIFTCNAYSVGSLPPGLIVGWMNSKHRMLISEKTGVAYDPSCVQHQVRITRNLTKGLAFGALDVQQREIIWLEMPFDGQLAQNLHPAGIEILIRKLSGKLSIGRLLEVKAQAQQLELMKTDDADEVYTARWAADAADAAAVTSLLID